LGIFTSNKFIAAQKYRYEEFILKVRFNVIHSFMNY
jgi:hypothetical protein